MEKLRVIRRVLMFLPPRMCSNTRLSTTFEGQSFRPIPANRQDRSYRVRITIFATRVEIYPTKNPKPENPVRAASKRSAVRGADQNRKTRREKLDGA